jgi:hypothetical protein
LQLATSAAAINLALKLEESAENCGVAQPKTECIEFPFLRRRCQVGQRGLFAPSLVAFSMFERGFLEKFP